jgi:hypothetical protein
MGWLEDTEYEYEFKCPGCSPDMVKTIKQKEKPVAPVCEFCRGILEYIGFKPVEFPMVSRISFEKNGRIGYAITTGKGETTCISKSKYEYMKTAQNKSHLSKEYENHVKDGQMEEFGRFRKTLDSKATVSKSSRAEATGASND